MREVNSVVNLMLLSPMSVTYWWTTGNAPSSKEKLFSMNHNCCVPKMENTKYLLSVGIAYPPVTIVSCGDFL